MRLLALGSVALGVASALAGGGLAVEAVRSEASRPIEGYGLSLELPDGWDGRVSRPPGGRSAPQLVAGNYRLPPDDGSLLAQRLPPGGVRLTVWDYGAPAYPPPAQGLPRVRRADLGNFEGVPIDHTTGSYSFVAGGRLFQLLATFAEPPAEELLADTNEVVASLQVGR
jgi:hypothetical protein